MDSILLLVLKIENRERFTDKIMKFKGKSMYITQLLMPLSNYQFCQCLSSNY